MRGDLIYTVFRKLREKHLESKSIRFEYSCAHISIFIYTDASFFTSVHTLLSMSDLSTDFLSVMAKAIKLLLESLKSFINDINDLNDLFVIHGKLNLLKIRKTKILSMILSRSQRTSRNIRMRDGMKIID